MLVTSAMAASARSLARYLGSPRGARDADLARDLGVPPWKVRTVRDQSRSWSPEGIAAAVRAVAVADADIKGQAHDASYTLERLVLTVAGLRDAPLSRPEMQNTRHEGGCRGVEGSRQSEAAFLAIEDLRFAAWLPWMTPFEAALSSAFIGVAAGGDGGVLVAGLGSLAELAHSGLQARLDGLVALTRLLVLLVALDLGLDVRHV